MNHQTFLNQVADFHRCFKYRQPEPKAPDFTDAPTNELRPRLIAEEVRELKEAVDANDRIGMLDACCDLQYVTSGAVLAWGLRALWENYRHTMKLAKVRDMDGHIAAMLGLNAQMEIAARLDHGMTAFKMLTYIQERLTQAVYSLGFVERFHQAFDEVHRSNMSKLWSEDEIHDHDNDEVATFESSNGGYIARRADGKIIKSPSYSPANLTPFIQ